MSAPATGTRNGFSARDRKMFASAKTPLELAAACVRRVTDREAKENFGIVWSGDKTGLLFEYDVEGSPACYRLRRDFCEQKIGKPEENKYLCDKSRRHAFIHPQQWGLLEKLDVPAILVEGEKKCLAVLAWCERMGEEILVMSLGGVSGWHATRGTRLTSTGARKPQKGALPELDWLKGGRDVYVLFDRNENTSEDVQRERGALAAFLRGQRARVHIAHLPAGKWDRDGKSGPDDFLGAGDNDAAFLEILNRADEGDASEYPQLKTLGDDLPAVAPFELRFLPQILRPFIMDISERLQVPMDMPAAVAVAALAGCVNRRARIQPKQNDRTWQIVLNLWGAIIAPPGFVKSPVMRQVLAPLVEVEKKWQAEYAATKTDFAKKQEYAKLRRDAWREEFKRLSKKNQPTPFEPDENLEEPKQKRLLTTDATLEKLHALLAENPAGIMVTRDELAGWLSTLDSEERIGERQFHLECWNGDGHFILDRIGRGTIFVSGLCTSLIGNIQPTRARSYVAQAAESGALDDGLMQRLQILVWPDWSSEWENVDRDTADLFSETVARIFSRLIDLPADVPLQLRFDSEAQIIFNTWLRAIQKRIRSKTLLPAFASHLAKFPKLVPTLAALFELFDRAAEEDWTPESCAVSAVHLAQAIAFADYLESHARRLYSSIAAPEVRAARDIAAHIQAGDLRSGFAIRDVCIKGWSGLGKSEIVRAACDVLDESGWIKTVDINTGKRGGRPSLAFFINPKAMNAPL